MIDEQLRPRGITDQRVLQAMLDVPRHVFVPDQLQADAYADKAPPIDENQTISQPFIVAYMTQSLDTSPDGCILEIRAGSGYQAASLSRIVAHVYTVALHSLLAPQSTVTI